MSDEQTPQTETVSLEQLLHDAAQTFNLLSVYPVDNFRDQLEAVFMKNIMNVPNFSTSNDALFNGQRITLKYVDVIQTFIKGYHEVYLEQLAAMPAQGPNDETDQKAKEAFDAHQQAEADRKAQEANALAGPGSKAKAGRRGNKNPSVDPAG